MIVDTKRYTPALVVKENLSFSIPLYQRLFAWGEEQVTGLLMDMKEHFAKSTSPYYLGMLSCIMNNESVELIDGQQRCTVMTLMGIVLRDYYTPWEVFLGNGKRVNFVARTKDMEYLNARISRIDSHIETNKKMEASIKAIRSFMTDPALFKDDSERRKYAESVYQWLSFYFSSLPKEYLNDPTSLNKYFEAMNSYGKSLEQHEILKVELMKDKPNSDKEYLTKIWNAVSEMGRPIISRIEEDSIAVYRQKYEKAIGCCRSGRFDEAFRDCSSSYDAIDNETIDSIKPEKPVPASVFVSGVESADRAIISFPDFLRMTLDITLNIGGEYSFYRKEIIPVFKENPLPDIQAFYHNLLYCRLLMDYYIITKEDEKNGNRYDIMYGTDDEHSCPHGKDCVIHYQSMLYVAQTPIYDWLKPLILELMAKRPDSYDELLKRIKFIDNAHRKLPETADLLLYDKVDRYWFWRLDYFLWEQKGKYFKNKEEQEIVNDYVFKANRSIEHLHPQHQEYNTKWDDKAVHSFGNLAMISQGFNSEQSDDPVTVKFARVSDQANSHSLQSIKLYRMYLDAGKAPGGWTVERMELHQNAMYEVLKKSFHLDGSDE